MFGRSLKLSVVKDSAKNAETLSLDSEALIAIAKEGGKMLIGGVVIVIFAGFIAKAGSEILVANLTP